MGKNRVQSAVPIATVSPEPTPAPQAEQPPALPESNGHAANGKPKLACPAELTQAKFMGGAKDLTLAIMGRDFELAKKAFSTGSFGWFDQKNVKDCSVAGVEGVTLHVQITVTVVGSKQAARS